MGINQLPPQAYTRETLMQAFDWIKTQPRQVQDLASSTDALVSVYMQARRRAGQHGVTHPVSSQSFKQDLKNLAEGLRQFEDDSADAAASAAAATNAHSSANAHASVIAHAQQQAQMHQHVQQTVHQAVHQPAQQQPMQPQHQPVQQHHYQQPQPQYHPAPMPPPAMAMPRQQMYDSAVNHLDSKSLEVVRLVQSRFNLSSENEALRMLISLGFEKVREIFPKS